jgi:hypothetical protein
MGCCAKGCLTFLVLGFLCLAVVMGGGWYVYHKLATNNLISYAPAAVPLEQPSDAQYRAAENSLARVKSANTSSREVTVAFTAADLNALMAKDPSFRDLEGHARVDIQNSAMTITLSVPLDSLEWSSMKGRWFNGTIRFGGAYENGELRIKIESARGGDYEIPGFILSSMNSAINKALRENSRDWQKDDFGEDFWKHVKSIRLEGDKLVVTTQGT